MSRPMDPKQELLKILHEVKNLDAKLRVAADKTLEAMRLEDRVTKYIERERLSIAEALKALCFMIRNRVIYLHFTLLMIELLRKRMDALLIRVQDIESRLDAIDECQHF